MDPDALTRKSTARLETKALTEVTQSPCLALVAFNNRSSTGMLHYELLEPLAIGTLAAVQVNQMMILSNASHDCGDVSATDFTQPS